MYGLTRGSGEATFYSTAAGNVRTLLKALTPNVQGFRRAPTRPLEHIVKAIYNLVQFYLSLFHLYIHF
jgi:hypothetical protein